MTTPAAGISDAGTGWRDQGRGNSVEKDLEVDPGNRSRVNESPQPARLGQGLDHETHQAHSRVDHPQALARRASAQQWTAEQLIAQGKTGAEICRVLEVTQPTYHRWRQHYGGMQAEEARRLTQLEKENARL